jgi:hypothetical protein
MAPEGDETSDVTGGGVEETDVVELLPGEAGLVEVDDVLELHAQTPATIPQSSINGYCEIFTYPAPGVMCHQFKVMHTVPARSSQNRHRCITIRSNWVTASAALADMQSSDGWARRTGQVGTFRPLSLPAVMPGSRFMDVTWQLVPLFASS